MQQEDDLRGLAKVMQFMRALSLLFALIHFYWYAYSWITAVGWNTALVDKILMNFQRTSGLFTSPLYTKLFSLLFLVLSCLGTRSVRSEKISRRRIAFCGAAGILLFFCGGWLLHLPLPVRVLGPLYGLTLLTGYCLMLAAGVWLGRLIKERVFEDPFNDENESFMQETRLMTNDYSVNLPTLFYYKRQWHPGWINVVNPFRATVVLGTPGSGKSYAIVNQFIKQQIEKGFSMYIYDFKFDDLSIIAYNHLRTHLSGYKIPPKFYVINFDDPRHSHRCNPIHRDFMTDISDAYESAYTIMLNLNKTWITKQGDFFVESPIILLAAIIWFLKCAHKAV